MLCSPLLWLDCVPLILPEQSQGCRQESSESHKCFHHGAGSSKVYEKGVSLKVRNGQRLKGGLLERNKISDQQKGTQQPARVAGGHAGGICDDQAGRMLAGFLPESAP